jgi:hypothetical protein
MTNGRWYPGRSRRSLPKNCAVSVRGEGSGAVSSPVIHTAVTPRDAAATRRSRAVGVRTILVPSRMSRTDVGT